MLAEGQRRRSRGTDVVIGLVESHGRRVTAQMAEGLTLVPRRTVVHRGRSFTEMDLDAVLALRPQVALVDEYAHTNVPGSRNEKRWQDVEELLDAGIDVVTTLNIQHLESLNDVVEQITGVAQHETIPDEVVRRAEQVELVDMTPEALRRRMVHGNVYPADRIDVALTHHFRPGNLTALRELALLWVADRVEEGLQRYRTEHGIATPWETKERVVVALSGEGDEEALIRRAVRIVGRSPGSDLLAVHVAVSDGLTGADPALLAGERALVESLGGAFHHVVGGDVAAALLQFAQAENATQIVLGGSGHSSLFGFLLGNQVVPKVTRLAGHLDVHILSRERKRRAVVRLPSLSAGVGQARVRWGAAAAALLLPGLTVLLVAVRSFGLAGDLLLYLLAVLVVALIGGLYPALVTTVGAAVLADYFLVPPVDSPAIGHPGDAAALAAFVVVALAVSGSTERTSRWRRAATRSAVEAATLSDLATGALRGQDDLPALLERVRETFGLTAVSLLELDSPRTRRWFTVASTGKAPPECPEEADTNVTITDSLVLAGHGRALNAGDRHVFLACAAQVAASRENYRRQQQAAESQQRTTADRRRIELLQGLAAELAVTREALEQLSRTEAPAAQEQRASLCNLAEGAVERVSARVRDLVDLSRLHAGALEVFLRPVDLDDVLTVALDDLGPGGHDLGVELPDDVTDVIADAALLTRVLTNLAAHALRRSPGETPPRIEAVPTAGHLDIRVIDHGPPAPETAQRGPDADPNPAGGVLRLCADLSGAIGGALHWEETAGGGLTSVLSLPTAAAGNGGARDGSPAPPAEGVGG
jgi:two-component system sensor histidine kinase KdpD